MVVERTEMCGWLWTLALVAWTVGAKDQQTGVRQFVQVTDFHMDPLYVPGSPIENMCRKDKSLSILRPELLDVGARTRTAGAYGDYKCDAPELLVKSAIRYMKKVAPNPDFILWTGDSSPHYSRGPDWSLVYSQLSFVTKHMYKEYGPMSKTKIVPALGNHDSSPKDNYKDFLVDPQAVNYYSKYISKGSFGDLLSHDAASVFKKCGYYVIRDKEMYENLTQTFVVLNTNLYYNNMANVSEPDPCHQLQWLEEQLKAAEDNERVFIVSHVPPGYFELHPVQPFFGNDVVTKRYLDIVSDKAVAHKVVAHFYGHTHTSSFRLFSNKDDEAVGVGFIAPSVTPLMFKGGVNPSIRVYDYDPHLGIILNFKQYYLPLDKLPPRKKFSTSTGSTEIADGDESIQNSLSSRRSNSKFLNLSKRETSTDVSKEEESVAATKPNLTATSPREEHETNEESEDVVATTTEQDNDESPESPDEGDEVDVVDELVDKYWTLAFDARDDFKVPDLSVKQMQKVYLSMKNDPKGELFKQFRNEVYVLNVDGPCDSICHRQMMCAIVNFIPETMKTCLRGNGTSQHQFDRPDVTTAAADTTTINVVVTTTTTSQVAKTTMHLPDGHHQSSGSIGMSVGVAVAVLLVAAVAVLAIWFRWKIWRNRERAQEFLLTDSVFKYDGYSQLEQP